MKEKEILHHLTGNYYAVEISDDTVVAETTYSGDKLVLWFDGGFSEIELNGSYTFLFLSDNVSEEDAAKVIGASFTSWNSDSERFKILLRSKGISGTVAVLEKIK